MPTGRAQMLADGHAMPPEDAGGAVTDPAGEARGREALAPGQDDGMQPRRLRPGQRSQVWIATVGEDEPALLFETADLLVEAPNWSADGTRLLLNGDGLLLSLAVDAPTELVEVELPGLPPINNDHVLAPDGATVLLSAMDGHLYAGPIAGGAVRRLSEEDGMVHYLHG